MKSPQTYIVVFATILLTFVSTRAVNISNTWMLPEEGFPVFYRYFRDRISWYEADAVCQFHHANLVTADSTSQYDAIRAYLKELDITENIWIGLSKTTEKTNFIWTNYRPLNGEGHWQQSVPKVHEALCVSMDPAADFLWKAMACGGPEVASFICELPVPSWAMGPKGCLLTELPSMTVLYIPEQLALELTSDCGLDGTKRITCKGNADREDILKQLTCAIPPDDFEDKATKSPTSTNIASSTVSDLSSEDDSFSSKTTKPWIWTSNTIDTDYGLPTRHRRETEDTLSPISAKSTTDLPSSKLLQKSILTVLTSTPNYDADTTSKSPERDITLDLSTPPRPYKSVDLKTTQVTDSTTQDVNLQPEEQAETSGNVYTTVESRALDAEIEDNGEYPSAIGQGQLFSIIENGTMFDIIEVNETSEGSKLVKEIMMETPQSETEFLETSTTEDIHHPDDNLQTTVVYQKEPPSETNFVTNKSVRKNDKLFKKQALKEKTSRKVNQQSPDKAKQTQNYITSSKNNTQEKSLSTEILIHSTLDAQATLNRTHRKVLPSTQIGRTLNISDPTVNFSKVNEPNYQHVEIKWHQRENENLMQMKLFVTTKRIDSSKLPTESAKENLELLDSDENYEETIHKIDSKLLNNNNHHNITANNESEIFITAKPEKLQIVRMRKELLPKSLLGETLTIVDTSVSSSLNEPIEPEPQVQPRPNRQRQLTRPQRRSFYPYFFSRVLG